MKKGKSEAAFAAGCFWGVEYVFSKFPGISNIKVGYMGGQTKNPTYQEVCTGITGHTETTYLQYDSDVISYKKLLEIFFECHDPTTMNRQGPDVGNQYRSAIFYYNEEQKKEAEAAKAKYEKKLGKKIATIIESAEEYPFYEAEEYHQRYYAKSGAQPYCHMVPKIKI